MQGELEREASLLGTTQDDNVNVIKLREPEKAPVLVVGAGGTIYECFDEKT